MDLRAFMVRRFILDTSDLHQTLLTQNSFYCPDNGVYSKSSGGNLKICQGRQVQHNFLLTVIEEMLAGAQPKTVELSDI